MTNKVSLCRKWLSLHYEVKLGSPIDMPIMNI